MKLEHITKKLFKTYATIFIVFFIAIISIAGVSMSVDINKRIISTQMQIVQTISQAVEQYFVDINNFSLSLMNSRDFKQAAIYDLPVAQQTGGNQQEPLDKIYRSAYEMFSKGYYVGVATKQDVYLWMGERILINKISKPVDTYNEYAGHGKPVLMLLEHNNYLSAIDVSHNKEYNQEPTICLARSINVDNRFSHPQAFLEVHALKSDFSRYMNRLSATTGVSGLSISVFTADGSLIYGDAAFPREMSASNEWQSMDTGMNQLNSIMDDAVFVLYQIPTQSYYQPLTDFLFGTSLLSLIVCGVMVFVTYRISKELSKPINEMSGQLEQMDLSGNLVFSKVSTNIYELDVLAQTVTKLNEKLRETLDDIVLLRTADVQSRLMALQSQMQPHFLYNTLTVIEGLSNLGAQQEVSNVCRSLSQMMRYISSQQENGVSLYEEVHFLRCYMDVMCERFPDAKIEIDIPIEMLSVTVPKLILQPLVENVFKYSDCTAPIIKVKAEVNGNSWRIFVSDNGTGFTSERASEILNRCYLILQSKKELSASIDGMGLVNIYTRLHFFYKEDMFFDIQAGTSGGVIIGGR